MRVVCGCSTRESQREILGILDTPHRYDTRCLNGIRVRDLSLRLLQRPTWTTCKWSDYHFDRHVVYSSSREVGAA